MRELIAEASDVLVVAPVLTSKLHLWMNDTGRAREQADERPSAVLGNLEGRIARKRTRAGSSESRCR